MNVSRSILFALAATAWPFSIAAAQTTPLTVCQTIATKADGQDVVVRGWVTGHHEHGFFLSEGINDGPCPGWPRRFFTRPAGIPLEFNSDYGVKLTAEQERLNRDFLEMVLRHIGGRVANDVTATIDGVLIKKS